MIFLILILTILPIGICVWVICRLAGKPLPWKRLLRAMGLGVLMAPVILLGVHFTGFSYDKTTFAGALLESFVGAAIPEECLKFIMVVILARYRHYVTRPFDWVFYTVAVGMGFALIENFFYVFLKGGLFTAIVRALFAIPGHFFYSVIMGSFMALAVSNPAKRNKYIALALLIPIGLHGLYDTLASLPHLNRNLVLPVTPFFFGLVYCEYKIARKMFQRVDAIPLPEPQPQPAKPQPNSQPSEQ